jgi:cytochrome c553
MSKSITFGGLGALLCLASLALAQSQIPSPGQLLPYLEGEPERGEEKAAVCVACHGMNGNSVNPEWPSLAGQSAVYTAEQLRLFRSGVRMDPVMSPMAVDLTDEDIADLAVFYARQAPTGLEADPSYWREGEALYRAGNRERNIPACIACHGPIARGVPTAGYPALRAQHSVYTVKQLTDYQQIQRYEGGTPGAARGGAMMHEIAARMTAEDIRNVASYLQGVR